jgi:HTH-type transcriptional regulator/antitoxin HipB
MTSTAVRSPERLGEVIARIRRESGRTQSELAEELGVDRRYIYAIESGRPNLYARRLFELLDILDARVVIEDPEAT